MICSVRLKSLAIVPLAEKFNFVNPIQNSDDPNSEIEIKRASSALRMQSTIYVIQGVRPHQCFQWSMSP